MIASNQVFVIGAVNLSNVTNCCSTSILNLSQSFITNKTVLLRDRKRRTTRAPPPPPPTPKVSKMFVQFVVQNFVHFLSQILSNIFVQIWGGGTPGGAPPPVGGGRGYPRGRPPVAPPLWTDTLKTLPSRHTPYAGGNKYYNSWFCSVVSDPRSN